MEPWGGSGLWSFEKVAIGTSIEVTGSNAESESFFGQKVLGTVSLKQKIFQCPKGVFLFN